MRMFLLCGLAAARPSEDRSDGDHPALLFSYFREGPRCGTEAIHFAYTRDGGNFTVLNNNTPVLNCALSGYNSIRDPFVARDPNDKDTFHIVATAGGFAKGITVMHYWNMTLVNEKPVPWYSHHTFFSM